MSSEELQQVQDDLTMMRQIVKRDKVYAAADIPPALVIGLGALLCIPMLHYRLLGDPRLSFFVALAPGIFLLARRYNEAKKDRALRPVLWKEYRWSTLSGLVAIPTALGWMWWSQQQGGTYGTTAAALLFCIGFGFTMTGLMDSSRRSYLIVGLAFIVFAILFPTLEPHQRHVAGCMFLAILCLGSAAFVWWKTRAAHSNANQETIA